MLKLKTTILPSEEPPDEAKNEERYAVLVQFLDDKGISLVMRDAAAKYKNYVLCATRNS